MTFAHRIGNAQRGIGPLHLTGMFPGSAPPEEWITSKPEVEAVSGWHDGLLESLFAGAEYGNIATGAFSPVLAT